MTSSSIFRVWGKKMEINTTYRGTTERESLKLLRFFDRNRSEFSSNIAAFTARRRWRSLRFFRVVEFGRDSSTLTHNRHRSDILLISSQDSRALFLSNNRITSTTDESWRVAHRSFGRNRIPAQSNDVVSTHDPIHSPDGHLRLEHGSSDDLHRAGVRAYLEKYQQNELRFFGGASVVLARSTLSAVIDASQDGTALGQQQAQHDYLNYGWASILVSVIRSRKCVDRGKCPSWYSGFESGCNRRSWKCRRCLDRR